MILHNILKFENLAAGRLDGSAVWIWPTSHQLMTTDLNCDCTPAYSTINISWRILWRKYKYSKKRRDLTPTLLQMNWTQTTSSRTTFQTGSVRQRDCAFLKCSGLKGKAIYVANNADFVKSLGDLEALNVSSWRYFIWDGILELVYSCHEACLRSNSIFMEF